MDNINRYSKEADLFALDNKKEIIHDVGKIAKARTDLKRLVIETKELDSLVDLELEEKGRARGGKMTTPHEKGVLDGYIKELIRGQ
jgi:mevalonate kinase